MNRKIYLLAIYTAIALLLYVNPFITKTSLSKTKILYCRADYLLHAILFIPFPIIANAFMAKGKKKGNQKIMILLMLILFAILAETIHYFLPYRTFNPLDALANCAGIGIGVLSIYTYRKIFP